MPELDTIVETSLRSFYRDICSEWSGRENEMVNLYVHGPLAKEVRGETILCDLRQVGIEVAVRQLDKTPEHPKMKSDVRKDLVIWPTPGMTRWKGNVPYHEPLAVMECKVNHFWNRAVHKQNRREHQGDIRWLCATSLRAGMADFIGYAVRVENTRVPKELTCVRVQAGIIDERFLALPEIDASHGPSA